MCAMVAIFGRKHAATHTSSEARYVQYGCGWCAPKEWINFDASLTLRWERIPILGRCTKNSQRFPVNVRPGDIVEGLPIPDESCSGVYASHILEHLALDDFHRALTNTFRMLRKGGIFRLVVPDLEWSAREYLSRFDRSEPGANAFFLRETSLGIERRARGLMGRVTRALNTSAHLWMWDSKAMAQALNEHDFVRIRRCHFGDCEDAMFSIVEDRSRFEHAVAMEARRPTV
jgi:predicted SAM-dependent methyltransferase